MEILNILVTMLFMAAIIIGMIAVSLTGSENNTKLGVYLACVAAIFAVMATVMAASVMYLDNQQYQKVVNAKMDLDHYMITNTNSTEILAEINSICTNLAHRDVDYSRCQQELVQEYLKYRR